MKREQYEELIKSSKTLKYKIGKILLKIQSLLNTKFVVTTILAF
jgi:hypothetical protein